MVDRVQKWIFVDGAPVFIEAWIGIKGIPSLRDFKAMTGRSGIGRVFKRKRDLDEIMAGIVRVHAQGLNYERRYPELMKLRKSCLEWLGANLFLTRASKPIVEALLRDVHEERVVLTNELFKGEQPTSNKVHATPPVPKGRVGNVMQKEVALERLERHWGTTFAPGIHGKYQDYLSMGGKLSIGAFCDRIYMQDRKDDPAGMILGIATGGLDEHIKEGVMYLSERERRSFAVTVNGGLLYDATGTLLDTANLATVFSGYGWGIFVLGFDEKLYVASHVKDRFHHSSFFSGGPVQCGGELVCCAGRLRYLTNKTGHYHSGVRDIKNVLSYLERRGVRLDEVLVAPEIESNEKFYKGSIVNGHFFGGMQLPKTSELAKKLTAKGVVVWGSPVVTRRPGRLANEGGQPEFPLPPWRD